VKIIRRLADESPLVYALVVAVAAAVGIGEVWQKVILAAVALLFGLVVRSVTTSPTTLSNAVTDAAQATAQRLSADTVGEVGEVAAAGEGIVTGTVGEVLDGVGGLASTLAKGGS